jgi:thiol-disulfide isomerase/thioredoxin
MLRVLLATLFVTAFSAAQVDVIEEKLHASDAKTVVLLFYTSWCPACLKAVAMLNEIEAEHLEAVKILGVDLDDGVMRKDFLSATEIRFETLKLSLAEAAAYGVKETVPVIYIFNADRQIVKRYNAVPNQTFFMQLIDRLRQGYLENGTLPPKERIDLWKHHRE